MTEPSKAELELVEKIDGIIQSNTPCYRDLFGGQCEFTTGCVLCLDYFNVRQDITKQILALITQAGYKSPEELKGYVKLADDQSSPNKGKNPNYSPDSLHAHISYKEAQQDMVKDGWVKRVIEEK